MKKTMIMLACALALAGCKDNEDEKDDRLVGTKWATEDVAHEIFFGGNPLDVYEFTSTSQVDRYCMEDGVIIDSRGTYTYELEYPFINIYEDTTVLDFEFTDSRTMVRVGRSEYLPYSKYLKQ